MAQEITAYHTSDAQDLNTIIQHACDSKYYDGYLYGAQVAAFTTTTFRGVLPTITQYPRDAAVNATCYRYTMRFNPDNYFKFRMAARDQQVHYLLLEKSIPHEETIAEVLRECLPGTEDADWGTNFPDGQPNDSASRVFVNVFFYHAVDVEYDTSVSKTNSRPDYSRVAVPENYRWLGQLVRAAVARSTTAQDEESSDFNTDDLSVLMDRTRIDGRP